MPIRILMLSLVLQVIFGADNLLAGTKKRVEQYYSGYDLPRVVKGLVTNPKIRVFGSLDNSVIDENRESYLSAHPSPPYEELVRHFDRAFPDQKPLLPGDPHYLDPTTLRHFESAPAENGLPAINSIETALGGINRLVNYAQRGEEDPKQNESFVLATRYYLKRVLVHLKSHPEDTNEALIILASVGLHCRTERTAGLQLVETMFYGEELAYLKIPRTIQENLDHILDGLRERVFRQTIAFNLPKVEPAHTDLYYRDRLHSTLGIKPGLKDPGIHAKTTRYHVIPEGELVTRFFQGKVGSTRSRSTPEQQRSHIGYTPENIAKAIVDAIKKNPDIFNYEDLLDYFLPHTSKLEVEAWGYSNKSVLQKFFYLDEEMPFAEYKEFLAETPLKHLKMAFVSNEYIDNSTKPLSERGLRKALLISGHLIEP